VRERHAEKSVARVKPAEGEDAAAYTFPPIHILEASPDDQAVDLEELEEHKQVLLDKLKTYKIDIVDIDAIVGPTVTLYELTPADGVKIRRITELENDLAMAMAAPGIRMIAPIPGKSAIGVEIPNRQRELVKGRDLIGTERFSESKMELPVPIGKTIEGDVYIEDLAKMPHLLIAGATGSGKSVGLNTLITGLLYKCSPQNLKFVMIDPKKIELTPYRALYDHYIALPEGSEEPIVTDFSEALGVLKSCEKEMEERYDLLSAAAVRGIKDYNKRVAEGKLDPDDGHRHLPYIVVVVDELADLMMTAGKDIEGPIARLAQMARAVGIHLVLATQRPSVDVITGLIKANFPSRMAYQVSSKIDSRTIIDQGGAEALMGNGDLLYMNGSRMIRLQGPYVSMEEIEEITAHIGRQPGPGPYALPAFEDETSIFDTEGTGAVEELDAYFADAARIIVRSQQGSVSLLQRKLSVGYTRAARIVDQLEDAGIVGPFEGSKARAVLVPDEATLDSVLIALDNQ
jgi:S-DNA-T family DNA segregation ATPase FtsK/SpoIIIE